MSPLEKEALYIDLVFPHWFFGLIKNMFQSGKALKPSEIERIVKLEQAKLTLLNSLIKKR
jgi:spore coat protein I